jgi:2-oxoglutarate dehydrogenase complex dehydrogenase (E1) component-like enzyme
MPTPRPPVVYVFPVTEKVCAGVCVATPTLPPARTVKRVDEEVLTASKTVGEVDVAHTVRRAYGVEVPRPKRLTLAELSQVKSLSKERLESDVQKAARLAAPPPVKFEEFEMRHVAPTWKQPAVSWTPLLNVDVAPEVKEMKPVGIARPERVDVAEVLRRVASRPPENVDVPAVSAATVMGPEKVEVAPSPLIEVVAELPT